MRLSIGDKLLVMQSASTIVSPWGYTITNLRSSTTIATASGITADYVLINLTAASDYNDHTGEVLHIAILNGSGTRIEEDTFVISGIYGKLTEAQYLVGLLGENQKQDSSDPSDFQDGHRKQSDVTIYADAALATARETYDWTQTFVTDFTPDARYQRAKIIQKAT